MSELLTLCAWCGVVIRPGKMPVSHGVCRECADRLEKELP